MPLRYADLHRRSVAKDDAPKNMTDFLMEFEISEVLQNIVFPVAFLIILLLFVTSQYYYSNII